MENKIIVPIAIIISVFFISLAWILSPVDFSIDINMDNETKESVIAMSEIQMQDFIEFNMSDCTHTEDNTLICKVK